MKQKGVFVILSGNSGTGKNFLQDCIVEAIPSFIRVPKYISRDAREGEDTSVDKFSISPDLIQQCTWSYSRNGNVYGIDASDLKEIIERRK